MTPHLRPLCLLSLPQRNPASYFQCRFFHPTLALSADASPPDHYATLSVPPHATPAQIKSQFYTLSKLHHPDRNPGNPSSASKFVAISEAYHVLSSPAARAKYDAQFTRPVHHRHTHPTGSHSSHAAGPAGSRPASGLSRRRTQFKGPPPSFYRSGGYGAHSAKRTEHQTKAESAGSGSTGGMGFGQEVPGPEPFIPHWDRAGHFRTHESIRKWRETRAERGRMSGLDEERVGGSMIVNFFLVTGVVALVIAVPVIVKSKPDTKKRGDG